MKDSTKKILTMVIVSILTVAVIRRIPKANALIFGA